MVKIPHLIREPSEVNNAIDKIVSEAVRESINLREEYKYGSPGHLLQYDLDMLGRAIIFSIPRSMELSREVLPTYLRCLDRIIRITGDTETGRHCESRRKSILEKYEKELTFK